MHYPQHLQSLLGLKDTMKVFLITLAVFCLLCTTYSKPTDSCNGGISFRAKNMTLVGFADNIVTTKNIEECAKKCSEKAKCFSGMFYPKEKESNCILNSQSRQTKPDMYQPEKQDSVEYFEPCQKSSSGGCTGNVAFRAANRTLVGSADQVTTAKDIEGCAKLCNAKSGCLSGMFYPKEKEANCVLNSQSRQTKPDMYQPEKQDSVEYFEPCRMAAAVTESPASSTTGRSSTTKSGTTCNGTIANRTRSRILVGYAYKVASAANLEKCAKLCVSAIRRCKSGMFYAKEKKNNCIFNTESRATQPGQYVEEKVDDVEYFEPCQRRRLRF